MVADFGDEAAEMTMDCNDAVLQFAHVCEGNTLDRRKLIARGLALGLSLPAVAAVLNATRGTAEAGAATRRLAASTPQTSKALVEGYNLDFSRMDPVNTEWADPSFNAMYEGLCTVDAKQRFVSQLAESWHP